MADKERKTQSNNRGGTPGESFGELHHFARTQMHRLENEDTRRWNVAIVGVLVALLMIVMVWVAIKSESTQIAAKTEDSFAEQGRGNPGKTEVDEVTAGNTGVIHEASSGDKEPGQARPGDRPAKNFLFIPVLSSGLAVCQQADEVKFEVLSGPRLDPPQDTVVRTNKEPRAQAYWTIRNTSTCKWKKISLYSITNGSTLYPRVTRKGTNLKAVAFDHTSYPGDFLEVQVLFQGDDAQKISAEWIIVVNGYQLYTQPHLNLDINKWVIVQKPVKANESQPGNQIDVNALNKSDPTSSDIKETPPVRPVSGTPTQSPPIRPTSEPPDRP